MTMVSGTILSGFRVDHGNLPFSFLSLIDKDL